MGGVVGTHENDSAHAGFEQSRWVHATTPDELDAELEEVLPFMLAPVDAGLVVLLVLVPLPPNPELVLTPVLVLGVPLSVEAEPEPPAPGGRSNT